MPSLPSEDDLCTSEVSTALPTADDVRTEEMPAANTHDDMCPAAFHNLPTSDPAPADADDDL
jgi:hypothetical protein